MQNVLVNSIPAHRTHDAGKRLPEIEKVTFIHLFNCKPKRKSSAAFPKGGFFPEAEFMNIRFCEVSGHNIESSQT
jgi:hypothetical protein